jgi:hypothetical protein
VISSGGGIDNKRLKEEEDKINYLRNHKENNIKLNKAKIGELQHYYLCIQVKIENVQGKLTIAKEEC